MSQIKSYTTNFSMKIPEFNIATWHDAMEYNFTLIDALLGNFFEINNFKGPWLIVTSYQANDIVYINDEDDQYVGKIFKVLQNHVSGNTKFETFYTAHPEYYEEYADMNGVVNYFNLAKDYAIKTNGKVVENGTPIDYSAKYYANQSANSATLAGEHESNALTYKTDAESAKNSAESYATAAQGYMNNAKQYKNDALSYKNSASDSATLATQAKTDAQSAANSASSSQTGAETAEQNAQSYATSASSSATAASNSANDALGYKNDAQSYANSAANYDSTYQQYLEDTQTASTDAQTAASGAQTAKDNAVTWAEGTDEEVTPLGGEHSAKGWAGVIKSILANIVCNTTTIDPGDPAEVTSTGDEDEIILNFFIPQGLKGDTGDQGIQGVPGQDGADGQDGFSPSATVTQSGNVTTITITDKDGTTTKNIDLSDYIPYSGATGAIDLNAKDLKNVDNLAVGTATVDNNEKILSVGQNRIVSNNANGLFISSTTSQTRKGMYGVPMALEIQFNSNNQAYSYPLGFHDMNSNNNGGQFLFTSFSGAISAASAGDVMVENDKGGLIFNTGASKTGSKMRFTVGNWASTPQITVTANNVGIKTLNPNSSYALDVNGTLNASNILINGQPLDVGGDANVQYVSGGGGSLVDTDTQQEIPLSQINDMPQVLQNIRDSIPTDTSDLTNNAGFVTSTDLQNDYVTIATSQKMLAAKAIFGTDVAFGSDTTQKNLLAVISNSNSTAGNWIGRLTVGAKNKTFIMGTYGTICVLGAHSWTNAQQGTGAAWEPVYINPDGDKAVYIGGSPINGKQALMVIQNVNANTTGTVKINRSTNLTNNFKDVACWSDDVRKFSFTSISGYNASVNQTLTHDSSGNLKWVNS